MQLRHARGPGRPQRDRSRHRQRQRYGRVATQLVTICNLPATVTTIFPVNGTIYVRGLTVFVSAVFRDKGVTDKHTCTIAWGDGTTTRGIVLEGGGLGGCHGSRAYTATGRFRVLVHVTDDDGDTGTSAPRTITVL